MNNDFTKEKINIIDEYMESLFTYDNLLVEPMKYSLFASGKRLRPLIMLLLAEAFDIPTEKILPFCSAVEMIHTYSLIHDDLPCLDNDDLRRGKPTCHKVFGEANALLAGDALLNLAHEVLLSNIEDKNEIKSAKILSTHAGITGMIGGQAVDVYAEENKISEKELLYIHENKTGKLLNACFVIPCVLKGYDEKTINDFYKIGMNYGISFQILDDILDVTSTDEVLGKPVGSDEKNDKTTYVSLYGLEKAKEDYEKLKSKCLELLLNYVDKENIFYKFISETFSRKY